MTRDNAIASNLWRPRRSKRAEPTVPDRADPGSIASAEKRQRAESERSSGNSNTKEESVRLF